MKRIDMTPNNKDLPTGSYCYCDIAVEGVRKEYCYMCEIDGIEVGDFVEVPFGRDNELLAGKVTSIKICTATDAPYLPERTKKIARKLEGYMPTPSKMLRDIQLIKEIYDSGKIIRAGMASGTYAFIYETICPDCGKHRLVRAHVVDWKLHRISVFEEDDGSKRAAAIQTHLDKHGIGLQLTPDLEKQFRDESDTCICYLDEPNTDPLCFHPNTNINSTEEDGALDQLISERLAYLCNRQSELHIRSWGTTVTQAAKTKLSKHGIKPEKGVSYYSIETLISGSEQGSCRVHSEALNPGARLELVRKGTIWQDNSIIAVYDGSGNRIGNIDNHLAACLAILIDLGRVEVLSTSFLGIAEEELLSEKYGTKYAKIASLIAIHTSGHERAVPGAVDADAYDGKFPDASEEYRRLIVTIKRECPNDWLAVNSDGILYRTIFCDKCGGTKTVDYDFGFNTEHGFFYLWKEIPEENVWDMLERDGIDVVKLENMEPCECGRE